MNFYNFNINDFRGATWHLSRGQRGIYRDLIDMYYLDEKPLVNDTAWLAHKLACRSDDEQADLLLVLKEFFVLRGGKWHHRRIDREIKNYRWRHRNDVTLDTDVTHDVTHDVTLLDTDVTHDVTPDVTLLDRRKRFLNRRNAMIQALKRVGVKANTRMKTSTLEDLCKQHKINVDTDVTLLDSDVTPDVTLLDSDVTLKNAAITNNQYIYTTTSTARARDVDLEASDVSDGMALSVEPFAMRLDWSPADVNALALLLRQARLPAADSERFAERLAEFKLYWSGKPTLRTESEWVHALLQSLLHAKNTGKLNALTPAVTLDAAASRDVTPAATVQPVAAKMSATAKSRDCLRAAKQAVLDGRVQTVTTNAVFALVCDGLLECLGHGFAYPPAADAWDITLKTWDAAFAKLHLADDAESLGRIQTAFNRTIQAVLKSENRAFPKADEVIAHFPMRLVPKAIECKMSAEERAASDLARQQALKGGLGRILEARA